MLGCVDRFDFNWQVAYFFADDAAPLLPAGTILHQIAIFDNTAANRHNPDPTVWVGYGQRSVDEMDNTHVTAVFLSDDDFNRQIDGAAGQSPIESKETAVHIDRRCFSVLLSRPGVQRASSIHGCQAASGQQMRQPRSSAKSLSRQFAQWVVGLRYEDLPAAVVDRVKGLTLQNLASALVGSQLPAGSRR